MTATGPGRSSSPGRFGEDALLLQRCITGDETAWNALLQKYSKLVFSVAMRRGLSEEDAADISQSVFLALLNSAHKVREPAALAAWLIRTTVHLADKLRHRQDKYLPIEVEPESESDADLPGAHLEGLEREALVRQAISEQSTECQRLIQLLFFSDPPVPYENAAVHLGIAKGSIGATRMRCLEKLRRWLEEKYLGMSQ